MIKIKDIMFSQPINGKDITVLDNDELLIITPAQFMEMYTTYKKEHSIKKFSNE